MNLFQFLITYMMESFKAFALSAYYAPIVYLVLVVVALLIIIRILRSKL